MTFPVNKHHEKQKLLSSIDSTNSHLDSDFSYLASKNKLPILDFDQRDANAANQMLLFKGGSPISFSPPASKAAKLISSSGFSKIDSQSVHATPATAKPEAFEMQTPNASGNVTHFRSLLVFY